MSSTEPCPSTTRSSEAPIGAMAEVAGPAWTREYELAWTEAVGVVAGVMIEGAEEAVRRAA